MGKLLHGAFEGAIEWCGVSSDTTHVVELALDGNESALLELAVSTLSDAEHALAVCHSNHCDNHYAARDARLLLDRVLCRALEDAEIEREKSERAGCPRCSGVCSACTPGAGGGGL